MTVSSWEEAWGGSHCLGTLGGREHGRQAVPLCPASVPPSRSHAAFQSDIIFQDLEKLKSRPAHLGVFLRYIFSQADPSPLVSQASVSSTCLLVPDKPLASGSALDVPSQVVGSVGHLRGTDKIEKG